VEEISHLRKRWLNPRYVYVELADEPAAVPIIAQSILQARCKARVVTSGSSVLPRNVDELSDDDADRPASLVSVWLDRSAQPRSNRTAMA